MRTEVGDSGRSASDVEHIVGLLYWRTRGVWKGFFAEW